MTSITYNKEDPIQYDNKYVCTYCFQEIKNTDKEYHNKICIYYVYNTKYNKHISNEQIQYICSFITIFQLHKFSISHIFKINSIVKKIIIKNRLNENILYINLINYLLDLNIEIINYKDLITIIEHFTYSSFDDIQNIINSYKICDSNA